jgi:hypothetical protein
MSDFKVVPNEIRETLDKGDSLVSHLLAGDTVFVPGKRNGGAYYTYMKNRYQRRVVSRTAIVEGVKGVVVWLTPIGDAS